MSHTCTLFSTPPFPPKSSLVNLEYTILNNFLYFPVVVHRHISLVYHPTTLPCPTEPMAPFPRPSSFCRAASAASSLAVFTYCPSYQ